jgi:hypothetical protein
MVCKHEQYFDYFLTFVRIRKLSLGLPVVPIISICMCTYWDMQLFVRRVGSVYFVQCT